MTMNMKKTTHYAIKWVSVPMLIVLLIIIGVRVKAQREEANVPVKLTVLPRASLSAGNRTLNETGLLDINLHQDACIYLGTRDKRLVQVEVEEASESFTLNSATQPAIPYAVAVNRDLQQNQFGQVATGQQVGNGVHACGNGSVINTRFEVDPRYTDKLANENYSQNVNIVLSPP